MSCMPVKKMFRDYGGFRDVGLFVDWSTVVVETIFKSSFGFSYVLFVTAFPLYHVYNFFRVAVAKLETDALSRAPHQPH